MANAGGTRHLLQAVQQAGLDARFYYASSSEIFGKAQESPQNERTLPWPRSLP